MAARRFLQNGKLQFVEEDLAQLIGELMLNRGPRSLWTVD